VSWLDDGCCDVATKRGRNVQEEQKGVPKKKQAAKIHTFCQKECVGGIMQEPSLR
jgi:hypothetical protein